MYIAFAFLGLGALAAALMLNRHSAFFTWHLQKYSVKRIKDLPYINDDHPKHLLDVYLPKNSGSFPIVHFIYGGYWNSGDKRYRQWLTGLYGNIGTALARRGIGVVISNYRLNPEVTITGQISDVSAAISWTVNNAGQWDWNGKLFVMGHSAGGHIITLLASNPKLYEQHHVNPEAINGYIALSPVLDIQALVKSHDEGFNRRISFPVFGKSAKDWREYSPIDHLLARPNKSLRLSIIIGEADFEHIRTTASAAHKKLQKAGLPATLNIIPNYYHTALVTRFGQRKDPVINIVMEFVEP